MGTFCAQLNPRDGSTRKGFRIPLTKDGTKASKDSQQAVGRKSLSRKAKRTALCCWLCTRKATALRTQRWANSGSLLSRHTHTYMHSFDTKVWTPCQRGTADIELSVFSAVREKYLLPNRYVRLFQSRASQTLFGIGLQM